MDSFNQLWGQVCSYCQNQGISDVAYKTWISCLEPVSFDNNEAVLFVRSSFQRNIINKHYINMIADGLRYVLGFDVPIKILTEEERPVPKTKFDYLDGVDYSSPEPKTQKDGYPFTFDTFIVGASNKFAHAAALAVAANPAGAYNPLFIYGDSGLGKTHLLNAIRYAIQKDFPGKNVVFVKGEQFTNELIDAIRNSSTHEFRQKYRQADVLLMDDIQFIGGKESTQEEFFHTFNTIYEAGNQIVLSSDRPPKEIQTLEDRLRTRFEWGLLADVQAPDFETRIAIVNRKAEVLGIDLSPEITEYIANRLKNNIRQLEGAVKKIKAYQLLAGDQPTIALAQNAIRDILNDNQPLPVTVERIISEVARVFGVTPEEIRSKKRSSKISDARQAAVFIVREITQMSMANIGEEFGGRDHSTIVYAIGEVEKNMASNSHYRGTIADIIKNIRDH